VTSRVLGSASTGPGIVHLGAGAFARAHTWWATAIAADAKPGAWSVIAVAHRSHDVVDALRRRRGEYDVALVGADGTRTDRVRIVADAMVAADDPERVVDALAAPHTRVVTVTATEAAYRLDDSDLTDPPLSLVGQIVSAAQHRVRDGVPPPTVVVCDNVEDGGPLLRRLAVELADRRGLAEVADHLASRWAFPRSVVDRVVPAVAPGCEPDVVADPAFRWVIQSAFADVRPAWEEAGALLVPDAGPWQLAKLLLVNAPHSLLAYLGLALGHRLVGEAMGDATVRAAVEAALTNELVPCVPGAPRLDPQAQAAETVRRFAAQVVPHDLRQIGAGGSAKLPHRLGHPLRRNPDGGWPTLCIALWVLAIDRGQVTDPKAEDIAATATDAAQDRAARVLDLLGLDSVASRDRLAGWLAVLGDPDPSTVRDVVAAQLS